MVERKTKRISRPLSEDEQQRLKKYREQIARELPDLIARNQLRHDAQQEATLSGEFRRAIHASELSLNQIAATIGLPLQQLDHFLTGEATLRSDVMDRLAKVLDLQYQRTPERVASSAGG